MLSHLSYTHPKLLQDIPDRIKDGPLERGVTPAYIYGTVVVVIIVVVEVVVVVGAVIIVVLQLISIYHFTVENRWLEHRRKGLTCLWLRWPWSTIDVS